VIDADDRRWLRGGWRADLFGPGRHGDADRDDHGVVPQGKFNAGQKLNSVVSTAALVVLAGTGLVMYWNRSFPQTVVQGANFVHGSTAVVVTVLVVGHVVLAVRDRVAMRSMLTGRAPLDWARRHHRKWVDAETGG
jgi:formate dehydrogenase subunit gamma